jgi:maltooligosyltrehalose trehalohydrolase
MGKLKIGAALVFTSPFVPMFFQGEEWGASTPFLYFTDYQEPELAKAVREGRCHEFAMFGWKPEDTADPQAAETFEKSKLKWPELKQEKHAEIFNWYKQLIRLHRDESLLNDGRLDCIEVSFNEATRWLIVKRGNISIICNLSPHEQSISLRRGRYQLLLTSEADNVLANGQITMAPETVTIIKEIIEQNVQVG